MQLESAYAANGLFHPIFTVPLYVGNTPKRGDKSRKGVEKKMKSIRRVNGCLSLSLSLFFFISIILAMRGQTYNYTAAAKSITANWKALFFASLDPEGFITVDKPPVALWFQAASSL
jgi:hypothetical protein